MAVLKELRRRHSDSDGDEKAAEPGACAECTSLCHLLHWDKTNLYPSVVRFFKIMLGGEWNKFMLLPPVVTATVAELVNKEIELEDTNGVRSIVTLSSSNNGLAFQNGWESFTLDHNISIGDFLVFNYIKGSHFIVHIYGGSGREKISFKTNPCNKSMASGSKSQPSATNITHDFGGIYVKSHCQPRATKRTQYSGDVNVKSSNPPSASNRTRNSRCANVKLSCAGKFHNIDSAEVPESAKKIKVKTEPQEWSEQVNGHANRKRGSNSLQRRESNQKKVKAQKPDEPSSLEIPVARLHAMDGKHHLELPAKLPVHFRKGESSKSVVLKDREGRLWPAVYHEGSDLFVLVTCWEMLNKYIGIQAGESYLLKVEDLLRCLYTIDVIRPS